MRTPNTRAALLLVLIFASCGSHDAAAQKRRANDFATPQAAAKALYDAWRAKSRTDARAAADREAIEKLFGTNFIARRRFAGCTDASETEKGLFQCVYEDPTDDLLNVALETIRKGRSWRVRRVTFAAEN